MSYVALSVCLSVPLLVTGMSLQNGWTGRDAVWRADSCGSKELFIRGGQDRTNPFAAAKLTMRPFAKLLWTSVFAGIHCDGACGISKIGHSCSRIQTLYCTRDFYIRIYRLLPGLPFANYYCPDRFFWATRFLKFFLSCSSFLCRALD